MLGEGRVQGLLVHEAPDPAFNRFGLCGGMDIAEKDRRRTCRWTAGHEAFGRLVAAIGPMMIAVVGYWIAVIICPRGSPTRPKRGKEKGISENQNNNAIH